MGCLIDIVVAAVLFVIIGLIAGEGHSGHGSASIHLRLPQRYGPALGLLLRLSAPEKAKSRRTVRAGVHRDVTTAW